MRKTIGLFGAGFAICLFLTILVGCEKEAEPRSQVLAFVKALRSADEIKLEDYLDLTELVRENAANVYLYDSAKSISDNIADFSALFAPDGKLRKLWTSKQIVIGEAEVRGDTAFVEVSFIDRDTRRQYYNKMGLKKTEQGWRIFAFKLL